MPADRDPIRIGIDTGGTFTDFVVYDPASETLRSFKLPSTPDNPARAVLDGLRKIIEPPTNSSYQVVHGSTVATNALLERKGARTALVTTRGFRDVLAIGRQNRPELYDLFPKLPPTLVPDELRFEVDERVDSSGAVLQPLSEASLQTLTADLRAAGEVESVAVCLLFSFLHPEHEAQIAEALRARGYFVSPSHEILPEYREYERTATTVVNAYVSPIFDRYLGELDAALSQEIDPKNPIPLTIMGSNGGTISTRRARREAVRCILSGPAGGVIAAHRLPESDPGSGRRLLTIDMGGTSTDVSLVAEGPRWTSEAEIGGCPIRVPVLDIHTIGAGGGSIASIDPAGGLRVGPHSAGADPGPACYGNPTEDGPPPTVTDANLLLGRLLPDRFLGGRMPLYPDRARRALLPLADSLALSLEEAAAGIVDIANAHMTRALRVISVERGHDPAGFTLVSFGGAGGLHAADLARELGIPCLIVPRHAATFSALGMLQADVVKDAAQTIMRPGSTDLAELQAEAAILVAQARAQLLAEGVPEGVISFAPQLDVRYRGQSYELNVPLSPHWRADFERQYRDTYGFTPDGEPVEIVNVRLQARGRLPLPTFSPRPLAGPDPSPARLPDREVWGDDRFRPTPVYDGDLLQPGNRLPGPALIARSDTTIWLPPGCRAVVNEYESLRVDIEI